MKIALIGSAPSSVALAPYESQDWTVWACSPGAMAAARRTDVWFELHRWEPGQTWFSEAYVKFLKEYPGTVWMSEHISDVQNCKVIPVDKLVDKYGPYFFTSTLSWMFALAMEENPESIGLWGVDMAATAEYGYQRAGCQYFAMLARSKGIEVGVPPESDLLRPSPLYGVCETQHVHIKMLSRYRELKDRHDTIQVELTKKNEEFLFLKGALDDLEWHMNTWIGNTDSMGKTYTEPSLVPVLTDLLHPQMIFDGNGEFIGPLYEGAVGRITKVGKDSMSVAVSMGSKKKEKA